MLFGIAVFAAALILVAGDANAIRVTMKRIVFEGGTRSEVITVINNSAKAETYRMGWRRLRMTPDKALVNVKDDDPAPDLSPADKYIRFSPRRVTVQPGQSQQIRLMVRYPRDLPDGEYRSHFWIHPEAQAQDFDETLKERGKEGQAVVIQMLTGITMPVFIRKGKLNVKVGIENVSAKQSGENIDVTYTLTRSGSMSFYGDLDIICTGGSKDLVLRSIHGIGIYTEVDHRIMTSSLTAPEGGLSACPNIKLVLREEDVQGKEIATQTVPVQR